MSLPEKLGIVAVVVFVAVVGYFLIDILSGDGIEEPMAFTSTSDEKDEGGPVTIQNHILDDEGEKSGAADVRPIREEIIPERMNVAGSIYGIVIGRVVDEGGKPIKGATLNMYRGGSAILDHLPAQEKLDIEEITDEEGRYELVGVERGSGYMILATHPDYAETSLGPLKVKAGMKIETADIVMGHGILVTGKVSDSLGSPVSGALVEIMDPIKNPFLAVKDQKPWKQVLTDGAGAYRFENVSFKTFSITASAKGYATQKKTENVHLTEKRQQEINFTLSEGCFIAGMVTDNNGMPLEEARVEATLVRNKDFTSSGTAFTLKDGAFMVEGLVEGTYVVRVSKEEYSDAAQQNVESGTMDLRLIMQPRGGVSGVVRDQETNQPIAQFQIRAMASSPGRPARPTKTLKTVKNNEGLYHITDLEPGVYAFRVSAKGYADCTSDSVTVVRDYTVEGVDLYMNRGGELAGKVINPKGEPIPGAKVMLNENNFQDNPLTQLFNAMSDPIMRESKITTSTQEDGTFHMKLIVPGVYQVAVSHPDYSDKAVNDVEVFLGKGNTPSMGRIVLMAGAKVHGKVRDASGAPIAGATVFISGTENNPLMHQTSTDREGDYQFNHMIPGDYNVSVQVNRLRGKNLNIFQTLILSQKTRTPVYLEEGRDTKVNIQLVE